MHVDDDAGGVAGGGGDEQVFHQPAVVRVSRLELRHGAEIDQLGIDRLAALQFLQQVHRSEADATVLDIDDRAVIGLEGVFGFEIDQLVGADDLEVSAERQNLAVNSFAPHLTAGNRNDATHAVADVAGNRHLCNVRGDGEGVFGVKLGCHHGAAMRVGSQSARIGNAIRITSRTKSVRTKGITPLKMVAKETSFTTLLMTKTFMPTGG